MVLYLIYISQYNGAKMLPKYGLVTDSPKKTKLLLVLVQSRSIALARQSSHRQHVRQALHIGKWELLIFTYYTVYTLNIDPRITVNIVIDSLIITAK